MSVETALAWLKDRQAEMVELLRELVEISSHTPDRAGVSEVAARWLGASQALTAGTIFGSVHLSPSGEYGHHVTMTTAVGRSAEKGAILLIGHHDTVFPQASFSGFREDGDLLRGPGVLDMKGGLVVMSFALGALAEAGLL